MSGDIFYVLGIVLVIAALAASYVGIRGAGAFPPSRGILVGVIGLFVAMVAVTLAFAIDLSEEEQAHREEELAHEEQQAAQEAGGEAPAEQPAAPGAASTLDVTSPQDGSLVFDPDGLEAQPGSLTMTYSNPSAVPHSLAVANAQGDVVDETSVFAAGEESVEIPDLAPGEYVFYCTVPGHREGGMEGDLTVTGGPTP